MATYFRKEMVVLLLVLLNIHEIFCCTCLPRTDEEKFCSADIAMRVMVHDFGTIVGNRKIYRVMPYRIYRSTVPPRYLNLFQVVTATNSAACGVNLTPGRQYFFTGHVEDAPLGFPWRRARRQIRVSLCDWFQEYFTLTRSQRRLINYPHSCSRG